MRKYKKLNSSRGRAWSIKYQMSSGQSIDWRGQRPKVWAEPTVECFLAEGVWYNWDKEGRMRRITGEPKEPVRKISIKCPAGQAMFLYYTARECWFISLIFTSNMITASKSVLYDSRKRALELYERGMVHWLESGVIER